MSSKHREYYEASLKTIEEVGDKMPSLLLHGCCGPCSCFPLYFLCPHFRVTLLFNNSNIYPEEEFDKRLGEVKKLLEFLKRDYGYEVGLIVAPYDHAGFVGDILPYADCREGGERCRICIEKRLDESYSLAESGGYDYFTTVMTVSKEKNSKMINEIGLELEKKHPSTKYLVSDFKKRGGYEKGKEMRIGYGLYYQNYCGCPFSLRDRRQYDEKKALEATSKNN